MTGILFTGDLRTAARRRRQPVPSEEPAFVVSADVINRFLASLGLPARYTAQQLLASTGKNFRTTAVGLARANDVSVEGDDAALMPQCSTPGWPRRRRSSASTSVRCCGPTWRN